MTIDVLIEEETEARGAGQESINKQGAGQAMVKLSVKAADRRIMEQYPRPECRKCWSVRNEIRERQDPSRSKQTMGLLKEPYAAWEMKDALNCEDHVKTAIRKGHAASVAFNKSESIAGTVTYYSAGALKLAPIDVETGELDIGKTIV